MLFKRWITAIVLIPFLLLILLKGGPLAFSILIAAITLVSMQEYLAIVSSSDFFLCACEKVVSGSSCLPSDASPETSSLLHPSDPAQDKTSLNPSSSGVSPRGLGPHPKMPLKIKICAYAASFLIIAAAFSGSAEMVAFIIALNIIIVFAIVLRDFSLHSNVLAYVAKEIQGIVYIPVFLCFLVFIRHSHNGALWIIWLWLIVAASDTGAYYCGTYLGKTPLAPKISPHKTMEGSAGGVAAAVAAGLIFAWIYFPDISFFVSFLFALTASAAGQMGDLFESALKRAGHIKDSGTLLPGHGGVLDRIDGLIFAAPAAFIFQWLTTNL